MLKRILSDTQTRFPLYDAHGNSVGTLGRSGTNSWSLADERGYDAWGRVRQGNLTGPLSARYCASIGHVQDDESGLVYMRARYYEPGTGRFISQDPTYDGQNWYTYCGNNPIDKVDTTGKTGSWFQIGEFWVCFDAPYPEPGMKGADMVDWNWGTKQGERLGSTRIDGIHKHGVPPPEKLKNLLSGSKKFQKDLTRFKENINTQRAGLGLTTLDATFMADPLFVIELFGDIGGGMQILANVKLDD